MTSLSHAAKVVCSIPLCCEVVTYEQVERPFHTAAVKCVASNMGVTRIRCHSPGVFTGLAAARVLPPVVFTFAAFAGVGSATGFVTAVDLITAVVAVFFPVQVATVRPVR